MIAAKVICIHKLERFTLVHFTLVLELGWVSAAPQYEAKVHLCPRYRRIPVLVPLSPL